MRLCWKVAPAHKEALSNGREILSSRHLKTLPKAGEMVNSKDWNLHPRPLTSTYNVNPMGSNTFFGPHRDGLMLTHTTDIHTYTEFKKIKRKIIFFKKYLQL